MWTPPTNESAELTQITDIQIHHGYELRMSGVHEGILALLGAAVFHTLNFLFEFLTKKMRAPTKKIGFQNRVSNDAQYWYSIKTWKWRAR